MLPWIKFVMGGVCYIISVIALSLRALEHLPVLSNVALAIGGMSMSMVVATMSYLELDSSISAPVHRAVPNARS